MTAAAVKYANLEKYVYWLLLATIAVIRCSRKFLRQWWQSLASVALLLRFCGAMKKEACFTTFCTDFIMVTVITWLLVAA